MSRQFTVPVLGSEAEERFWSKVQKGDGCWIWTGAKSKLGYGRFKLASKTYYAHRVAFAMQWGDSPDYLICHRCDNPSCVNPEHLYDQTAFDNSVEAGLRGRLRRPASPKKPYPEFSLFPHATGRWAKKIRGKHHYFGKIADDLDGAKALAQLNREWEYLSQGRTPPPVDTGDGCTIRNLCNAFLTMKRNRLDSGELSTHTFAKYYETCELLIGHFGRDRRVDDLRPDDFEGFRKALATGCGIVTLKSKVNRCRVILKHASDNRLIDRPVEYGRSFDRPSEKMLRQARNEAGERMYEANELRQILDAADSTMRAMVLLGVNAAFGNTDVASLPQSAVDLDGGWVTFPRPKTAVQRRIPLWPETVAALREAIADRPTPKEPADSDLCFVTARGTRFVRVQESKTTEGRYVTINSLSRRFESLLKRLGINSRKGVGFYTLRHVFETIASESRDQVAVDAIMGHTDSSMAGAYRERISDKRLLDVVNVVHRWLFKKTR